MSSCLTTSYNIPSYAFPVTTEYRQHLLTLAFSLQLGSDIRTPVLLPDSHQLRLAENFHWFLLSSSQPFHNGYYKVEIFDLSRFFRFFLCSSTPPAYLPRGARSEGAFICAPLRSAGGTTFSRGLSPAAEINLALTA